MSKKQRAPPPHSPPASLSSSSSEEEEESSSSSDEEQTINSSIPHHKKPSIQNPKSENEEESSEDEEDEDEDENPQPVKKPTSNSSIPHPEEPPIQNKKSESEEESSEDEDDNPQPVTKPTSNSFIPHPKKPPIQNQKSESKEESSDDGEEDEDEDEDLNPQPIKNPIPSIPEHKSEKKMLAPSNLPVPNKSNGKSPIIRIWSIHDEITILKAMVDHQSKNGRIELNAAGVKDLHDSIQNSLSIGVDSAKLITKMRTMRKKYMGASKKGTKLKFGKTHDKTIYDLSDKVWGKKEEAEADGFTVKENSCGAMVNKGRSLKREFPFIGDALGGNRLALEMLEMVDVKKAASLEANFKKLKAEEFDLTREVYKLLR